jgi:hypothetical protein
MNIDIHSKSAENLMMLNEYHKKLGSPKISWFFKPSVKISKEQCIKEAARMTKWLYDTKVKLGLLK